MCALCVLEVVEGGLCLLEVLKVREVMHCVLRCSLEVLEVREVMHCATLYAGGVGGDVLGVGRGRDSSIPLC